MTKHVDLGKKGEQLAGDFLIKKGYQLLEKNWRYGRNEVDLIFRDKTTIVFVEVKTRSTDYFGNPEESVTEKKQSSLIIVAEEYLLQNNLDSEFRFDIVSVIKKPEYTSINHIIDAFYPTVQE